MTPSRAELTDWQRTVNMMRSDSRSGSRAVGETTSAHQGVWVGQRPFSRPRRTPLFGSPEISPRFRGKAGQKARTRVRRAVRGPDSLSVNLLTCAHLGRSATRPRRPKPLRG